jgi:hypothetical protein
MADTQSEIGDWRDDLDVDRRVADVRRLSSEGGCAVPPEVPMWIVTVMSRSVIAAISRSQRPEWIEESHRRSAAPGR